MFRVTTIRVIRAAGSCQITSENGTGSIHDLDCGTLGIKIQQFVASNSWIVEANLAFADRTEIHHFNGTAQLTAYIEFIGTCGSVLQFHIELYTIGFLFQLSLGIGIRKSRVGTGALQTNFRFAIAESRWIAGCGFSRRVSCFGYGSGQQCLTRLCNVYCFAARIEIKQWLVGTGRTDKFQLTTGGVFFLYNLKLTMYFTIYKKIIATFRKVIDLDIKAGETGPHFQFGHTATLTGGSIQFLHDMFGCSLIITDIIYQCSSTYITKHGSNAFNGEATTGLGRLIADIPMITGREVQLHAAPFLFVSLASLSHGATLGGIQGDIGLVALDGAGTKEPGGVAVGIKGVPVHHGLLFIGSGTGNHLDGKALAILIGVEPGTGVLAGQTDGTGGTCSQQQAAQGSLAEVLVNACRKFHGVSPVKNLTLNGSRR